MFAGRLKELRAIEKALFQAKHGNPWHFLATGERGIGKSSLMLAAEHIARGNMPGPYGGNTYAFLTLVVEIAPMLTFDDLAPRLDAALAQAVRPFHTNQRPSGSNRRALTVGHDYGRHQPPGINRGVTLGALCDSLKHTHDQLGQRIDGTCIFLDEADKAGPDLHLGEFVKLFTERLTRIGCDRVLLGVSGGPAVTEMLGGDHESSTRVLNILHLQPLEPHDIREVIYRGLEESNRTSSQPTTIDEDALEWIARYSEGYPHFVQQYAFSAFETDTDGVITVDDVYHGANKEDGALEQLGERFFEYMNLAHDGPNYYREVLEAMAMRRSTFVSRKEIQESTGIKVDTLNHVLKSLVESETIVASQRQLGFYRLPSDSFGAWVRAKMKRPRHARRA